MEDLTHEDPLDEKAHASLLRDLKKLSGNKKIGRERVVRVSSDAYIPVDRASILKKIGDIRLSRDIKKSATLLQPLEKPSAKRLKRAAGFEKVALDLNRWETIVEKRRRADQLRFPLEKVDVRVITSERNSDRPFRSDLEKDINTLLEGAQLIEKKQVTEEEKQIQKAVSLQEIKLRSKELWNARLLRERIERKAALLNKSKSRKYHRILRREKLKRKKELFESLKMSDPDAALDVLNELEKTRVEERMSLKHKSSKWIQKQKLRAGHDKNALQGLKDTDEIRRDLLEKLNKTDTTPEDALQEEDDELVPNEEVANPFELEDNEDKDDGGFGKVKKFWEEFNRRKVAEIEAVKQIKAQSGKVLDEQNTSAIYAEKRSIKCINEKLDQAEKTTVSKKTHKKTAVDQENLLPEAKKKKTNQCVEQENLLPEAKKKKNNKCVEQENLLPEAKKKKKKECVDQKNLLPEDKKKNKPEAKKKKNNKCIEQENLLPEAKKKKKKEFVDKKNLLHEDKNQKKKDHVKNKKEKKALISQKKNGKEKKSDVLIDGQSIQSDIEENLSDIDELFAQGNIKASKIVDEYIKETQKQMKEMESKKKAKKNSKTIKKKGQSKGMEMEYDFTAKNDEDIIEEYLTRVTTYEEFDKLTLEKTESRIKTPSEEKISIPSEEKISIPAEEKISLASKATSVEVNLEQDDVMVMQVKVSKEEAEYRDLQNRLDGGSDNEESPHENLELLFQEDDTNIKEFLEKKNETMEKKKPKDDEYMKGWGNWVGPGISESKRKTRKLRFKAPVQRKNMYHMCGSVIYNENSDVHSNIRKLMVSQLPYIYSSVKDFEASVRQPIGRMFIPEAAHKKLTAPSIVLKMGTVIDPMGEEALLKNHEENKKRSKLEQKLDEQLKRRNLKHKIKRPRNNRPGSLKPLIVK